MTNRTNYQTPVDKLLSFGNFYNDDNQWHNYIAELGLGSQHIPDLIQMALDRELYGADSDNLHDNPKHWAPVHAWRSLAQLHVEEAIEPLMQLFHEREDCDLVSEEMPKVFGKIGAVAILSLQNYLADPSHGLFPRITASNCLEEIGKQDSTGLSLSIKVLTQQLKLFKQNPEELNGFIVASLTHLRAKESARVIKSAIAAQTVPEDIAGTWDEIQQALGVTNDELQLFEDVAWEDKQQVNEQKLSLTEPKLAGSDDNLSPVVEVTTEEVHLFLEVTPEQLHSVCFEEFPSLEIEKVENLASKELQNKEEQVIRDPVSSVEEVVSEDMKKVETKIVSDDTEVGLSAPDLSSPVEAHTEDFNKVEEVNLEDVNPVSHPSPEEENTQEEQVSIANSEVALSDSNLSVEDASLENVDKVKDITDKAEKIRVKPEVLHPPEFKLAVEGLSTPKKSSQGFGKTSVSEGKSKKKKKKKK